MPNAFTFDNGAPVTFKSRKDMYDYMIEKDHVIMEGDDAPAFERHVMSSKNPKAVEALALLDLKVK